MLFSAEQGFRVAERRTINLLDYATALRRVQIALSICTQEDRLDGFSRNAQAMNWFEVTKKRAGNLNYFSDDEESEWPANIDPSLLDKANEEKQLGDIDFPRQFRSPSHTSVTLSL